VDRIKLYFMFEPSIRPVTTFTTYLHDCISHRAHRSSAGYAVIQISIIYGIRITYYVIG